MPGVVREEQGSQGGRCQGTRESVLRWDGTAAALQAPVRAFAFSLNEMEALGESPQNTGMPGQGAQLF